MMRSFVSLVFLLVAIGPSRAAEFVGDFSNVADRVWVGTRFWANPMEDWRIQNGRLECISPGSNRSVHVLTRQLGEKPGSFNMRVLVGRLDQTNAFGSVGFRVGVRDELDDYRSWLIRGAGIDAVVSTKGDVILGNKILANRLARPLPTQFEIALKCTVLASGMHRLNLIVRDENKLLLVSTEADFPPDKLRGNIALVNNPSAEAKGKKESVTGARFWFNNWRIDGDKVETHDERTFGPVLWSMYTLSRGVLKLTAQMPPIGVKDSQMVGLQIKDGEKWRTLGEEKISSLSYTASFRVPDWNDRADIPFRLVYREAQTQDALYHGTIRKNPIDKDKLVLAALSCQGDMAFPNREIAGNLKKLNPDLVFFAGDQIYENSGGFPLIRTPTDRACLNYLRKWYLFGMSFGEVMRDRPTVCIPDDHDVYQGNLWGNGGNATTMARHAAGGYAQDRDFVSAVHRTQTSHLPDPFDPTPIKQGITAYYCDMVVGRVGFAIIADRMFKSGPEDTVATWPGRPDHIKDPKLDVKQLDKPGLVLLGDRQEKFLGHWAADWKGVDLKVVLSQTNFCNVANYHGGNEEYLIADLDSGGWPQTPRNRAVDLMRRGFALHVCGDQHLTTLVQYGIDAPGDGNFCFCVPAIANVYPRRWIPDKEGKPANNRDLTGGLPNTGDYRDGLGNLIRVFAVGNPEEVYRKGRLESLHDKACGFGIIRCDCSQRTFTLESWRLMVDAAEPKKGDQFPGWPRTIKMLDNYGRKPSGHLPTLDVTGMTDPVVQVADEKRKEIAYTLRIQGTTFRPMVFSPGPFTIRVGEPGTTRMRELRGIELTADRSQRLRVEIPE